MFVVSTADIPSLRNIQRGIPLLKRVLAKGEEQVRLILNRYDPKDTISVEDVERSLGLKVFWKVSNDYEAVMSSLNAGQAYRPERRLSLHPRSEGTGPQVTGMPDDSKSRSRLAQELAAPFAA